MKRVNAMVAKVLMLLLLLLSGPTIVFGVQPTTQSGNDAPLVRASVLSLDYGAELITLSYSQPQTSQTIPILSVLRDTLGDTDQENDLLRYVWIYTYAPPTVLQQLAASIPFLYHTVTTRRDADGVPPEVIDLSKPKTRAWRKVFRWALQNAILDPQGWAFRTLPRTNQKNLEEYRKAQIIKALAVLSLYEKENDSSLTPSEIVSMKSHLNGGSLVTALVRERLLSQIAAKEEHRSREQRANNWDLLRQRAEEEGLYFEPLGLPGESPSHAILWVARDDLQRADKNRRFEKRFLNIRTPWGDKQLLHWTGPTKTIYLDEENRQMTEPIPSGTKKELIPLAVYGLDFPRIPILLVDLRDSLNPKKREASGRAVNDVARYLANLSPYSNLKYLLSRSLLNFVTRKKGIDVNQPSRLTSYAELDALLLASETIDPELKALLVHKAETSQTIPVENSLERLPQIATQQHEALLRYATAQGGNLADKLAEDRNRECARFNHGKLARAFLKIAHIASLGRYHHHETMTPELAQQYEASRKVAYHKKRIEAAISSSLRLDHEQDISALRASLQFFQANSSLIGPDIAKLLNRAFYKSDDDDFRAGCLRTLALINDKESKRILAAIHDDPRVNPELRATSKSYLNNGPVGGRDTQTPPVPER